MARRASLTIVDKVSTPAKSPVSGGLRRFLALSLVLLVIGPSSAPVSARQPAVQESAPASARQSAAQESILTTWSLPADFTSTQGGNNWWYSRVDSQGNYVPLVWDPDVNGIGYVGNCWSPAIGGNDDPRYLYIQGVQVAAGPAVVMQPGEGADVAIGWEAPTDGTFTVAGTMTAVSESQTYNGWCGPACDDGIDFSIRYEDQVVGPARVLHGSAQLQSRSLTATFTVEAGDFIYFYVGRRYWQDNDASYANFSIVYETTDRAWELYTPPQQGGGNLHVSDRLNAVSATGDWAVGSAGTILHYTARNGEYGSSWSRVASPLVYEIHAIDMVSPTEGWAVNQIGALLHYDGNQWSLVDAIDDEPDLWALDMLGATEGWAAGSGMRIYHYSGGSWRQDTVPGVANPEFRTVFDLQMLSNSDGWAVGSGVILHYNGNQWQAANSPTARILRSLSMVAADEGWAVGDGGMILHYKAPGGWLAAVSPVAANLYSVSMVSRDEGWAVGAGGVLLHYNVAGWHVHPSPTSNTLRSISMRDAHNGWAVGSNGTILRFGAPELRLGLARRPGGMVARGGWATFVLDVRDPQGAPITDATVDVVIRRPGFVQRAQAWLSYSAADLGYRIDFSVQPSDVIGAYSVSFSLSYPGYADTALWSYFGVGDNSTVKALLLTNFTRMHDLGYGEVELAELHDKVNDLMFGNPNGLGLWLAVDQDSYTATAYAAWVANPRSVGANNDLVYAIDGEIERLRRDYYPNLEYVIIVGSSEVIPMYARTDEDPFDLNPVVDDKFEDDYWASQLDDTSYVHALCYQGEHGRYLTDNVYADLAYRDDDDDHELTPELSVGRLVETPRQIGRLIDDYLRLHGAIQAHAFVMASYDQLDTGNAVFSGYPGGVDRSRVRLSYGPWEIPPAVSPRNVYLLAGHANRQHISVGGSLDFYAGGCSYGQYGTYDVGSAEDSAMFTVACHAGVTLGNKLHNDPATGDISCPAVESYLEFPETWADLGMLAYAGSTSYAMGSASGDWDGAWRTTGTEYLVELMTESGRLVGNTVGLAFRDGMNEYWDNTAGCALWLPFAGCLATYHVDYDRKAIGGYVLYGIPTLRVNGTSSTSSAEAVAAGQGGAVPSVQRQIVSASATQVAEQVTVEIPVYRFDEQAGVVEIPGATQRGVPGEPYLPVLSVERTLPRGASVTGIAVDTAASTSVELNGRLAVPNLMAGDAHISNPFTATDYYPPGLALAIDHLSPGGKGSTVGMTLIPVQYNPVTAKVRIWTKIVVNLTYSVPDTGILVNSLNANKSAYAASESAALSANVSNAGSARGVDVTARLFNARTGAPLGESSLSQGLSLPAGASNQPFALPLTGFGASLEGKQVGVELQFYDAANGDLLASGETTFSVTDQTAPSAPIGLQASPGDRSVALAWQPCSEDDVWTYRIYSGASAGALSLLAESPASTARYTATDLTNLATYYFAVAAVDLAGHEGGRSAVVSAVPGVYVYLPITMRR